MKEKYLFMSVTDLKSTTKKIGQLYPVLVDSRGNVIDGEHRCRSDKNWKKLKLKHIKTEEDLLVARIVSNNVRRIVSRREKVKLLERLGEIYEKKVRRGEIAHRIAEETGMSYTWVIKYLPDRFKDQVQAKRATRSDVLATRRIAALHMLDDVLGSPFHIKALRVLKYNNTDFVSLTLERRIFQRFEEAANDLGLPIELCILRALEEYRQKMMTVAKRINVFNSKGVPIPVN